MDTKKELVESSLLNLLKSHSMEITDLMVDEIVLNYINCVIEEFDGTESMDDVDLQHFIEMMEAYIPGFAHIQSAEVIEWMFKLSHTISADSNCNTERPSDCHSSPCLPASPVYPVRSLQQKDSLKPTSSKINSTTECLKNDSSPSDKEESIFDEKVHRLLEIFPAACHLEAFHCLSLASGDMDEATQLILDRHEAGENIVSNNEKKYLHFQSSPVQDDKKVRDQMLQKYAYIDEEEDKKIYRPAAPKSVPKKLVRYLDNKVVSTKGERFTLFAKDDEDSLKKSYLNLKTSKKYRLH